MADIKGILAIGDLPEKRDKLFSVTEEVSATISSINITNTSGSTRKINLYLSKPVVLDEGAVVKRISPKDKVLKDRAMIVIDTEYQILKGEELLADSDGDKVEFIITGTKHEE